MIFIILIVVFVTFAYFYSTKNHNYWKERGVKHDKPVPLFGNFSKGYFLQSSQTQLASEQYWKYPEERVVGFLRSSNPELIIRDPELVKRVLITDFSYFHKREFTDLVGPEELILRNLFSLNGDMWRLLRQRLTPAFTTGKLKAMFPLIVERAERLQARIQAMAIAPIEVRELMARFTIDFIGACGFGLVMDTLNEDDSEFLKLGSKIFSATLPLVIKSSLKHLFPSIFKNIALTKHIEDDVVPIVNSILKQRSNRPSGRNDFIDLLLECQQKGTIVGESIEKLKHDGTPESVSMELTDELLAAQAFVFFAAGFETSSSTTSYTLHLLAYHPQVQKKVQENIDQVLSKNQNKLCYDAIKEMDYLEWAFKESMRMFPALGFLVRTCVRPYKVPDMDLTIEPGVKVIIPVEALQNDEQYFEYPEEFRPERFDPKNNDLGKSKYCYLPFGEGPRACIGERLGLMQSMAGLAAVLSKFSVEPAPNSVRFPKVGASPTVVQVVEGGLPLQFKERKK